MQTRLLNAIHNLGRTPVLIVLSYQDGEVLEKEMQSSQMYTGGPSAGPIYKQTFNGVPFAVARVERSFLLVQSADPSNGGLPEMHAIP